DAVERERPRLHGPPLHPGVKRLDVASPDEVIPQGEGFGCALPEAAPIGIRLGDSGSIGREADRVSFVPSAPELDFAGPISARGTGAPVLLTAGVPRRGHR